MQRPLEEVHHAPRPERARQDHRLVQSFLRGEPAGVRALSSRLACIPRMLAALNAHAGGRLNVQDIEDLSQEVAIIVLGKLPSFRPITGLEPWVHRICQYQFLNALRSARRAAHRTEPTDPDESSVPPSQPDVFELEELDRQLDELGPPEADVLRLKHFQDLTFAEVASRLSCSLSAAKARYYRGLERMRGRMGGGTP